MSHFSFIIPMRIFPKERPRLQKGTRKFYTPRSDEKEGNLEDYLWEFRGEKRMKILEKNLSLGCRFFMKGLARMDLDNCLKAVLDCGQGILWKNDRQFKKFSDVEFVENSPKDKIEIIIKELE